MLWVQYRLTVRTRMAAEGLKFELPPQVPQPRSAPPVLTRARATSRYLRVAVPLLYLSLERWPTGVAQVMNVLEQGSGKTPRTDAKGGPVRRLTTRGTRGESYAQGERI